MSGRKQTKISMHSAFLKTEHSLTNELSLGREVTTTLTVPSMSEKTKLALLVSSSTRKAERICVILYTISGQ